MSQPYLFKTERLGFRLVTEGDFDYLLMLSTADPKTWSSDSKEIEETIKNDIKHFSEKGYGAFLVFDIESGEFIGRAGFGITESGETEVGYVLHKKFWGKGYASEAVAILLKYAREHIDVDYIIAYADVGNIGSTRVMEKCGMSYYKTDIAKGIECRFYRIKNR